MLVNTCAVRDNAEQRVIGRMGELQRYKRADTVLGVVGCMAQRLGPTLLARVPRVDLVVGPDAYRNLPDLIGLAQAGQRVSDTEFRSWEHYEDMPPVREGAPTAYVTVQRGCDYRCTFCIVPYTRGPERSRQLEDVVRDVAGLAARGTSEVTLLGQTVNSYHDGRHDFADLLSAVGAVEGVRRLRFTSPYPTEFTPRVLEAMAATPAVCEHVHLPVQSGSTAVLKRMLRRYTREQYLEVVERLREFADERGHTLAQLAVAWVLAQPGVHVAITGARRPAHIEGIAPAAEIELSDDELAEIDQLSGAARAWGLTPEG
jgi:tRNA-2-methylthio-N6-dimethylallyladenosine synthase